MSAEAPKAVEAPVEAPKAVEETPVVPTEAPVETPVATESAPVVEEAPKDESTEAAPAKEEVKPVEEGVLGYKGPGLLKYVPHILFLLLHPCQAFNPFCARCNRVHLSSACLGFWHVYACLRAITC